LFRVGSFGVRRKLPPNGAGGHRTEVALGLSAMALFDRLPVETRREIRELPAIVQKLEEDANRIRQQRSELRQLEGKSTDSQVSARAFAAEERLSRRHTEVVTALEGIRVSLLRLHVGGLSVESFTTDLGDAGDLADRLKRLAEAHEEVERLSA
jgi:eukaryotic-like serine/threonine-protein kinase